jgi:hypothetical protein
METENSQHVVNGETNTNQVNQETNQETSQETNQQTSTYEEDMAKYTKIDNLDEDPVNGDNINYILVSFASPEGIMNCNIRALKIRNYKGKPAIFSTYEEADRAAKELQLIDKYFDVFVMTNGKWYAWDPNPSDRKYVQSEKFDNTKEQELMDGISRTVVDRQQKQLNEMNALIGKKKSLIDDSKEENRKRKEELIKQGTSEASTVETTGNTTENTTETSTPKKKSQHNNLAIKDKLRKRLEEKRMEELKKPANTTELASKSKVDEVKQTESNVKTVSENINKAKQLLAKMKQNN